MLAIDRHAWTNRWRSHHPGERLLLAGGGLLLALMLPPLGAGPLLVVVMAAATVAGAGVPMRAFMGVMAVPTGFLLAGAPFLAVTLDLHDGVHLGWSAAGAVLALKVSLRALGATACLAFLALTTPAAELLPWLRRLGVPAVLVEIALSPLQGQAHAYVVAAIRDIGIYAPADYLPAHGKCAYFIRPVIKAESSG